MKRTTVTTLFGLCLIVFTAILLVQATVAASDGRINEVDHLGGMAVYCVDENKNPDTHYTDGGIQVLDQDGGEVLFVSNETIVDVDVPETNTLLGEADLFQGPLSLYRLTSGEFQLNGVDEHSKPFEFVWEECTPVGAAVGEPESTSEPTAAPTIAPTTTGVPA